MDAKQKMAITGTGLVAAGIGLSLVGLALIAPAVAGWATRMMEKGTARLGSELEDASRKVGAAAGTLRRSFNEATRAGLAEMRRSS